MALSADQILSVEDLKTRTVNVPEWGGEVILRELSGKERDAYESSMVKYRDDGKGGQTPVPDTANLRAKLVARALVDDEGNRLFTDQQVKDLGAKSATVLNRLFDIVSDMSGLSSEDREQLEGNSPAAGGAASSSTSPGDSTSPSESSSDGSPHES